MAGLARWAAKVIRRSMLQAALVAAVAAASILADTRFDAPPRFDGAGYAVLGRSLAQGDGYREIDHPDRPPHDHYPPGYPLALAALWRITGFSARAAHALSAAATLTACLAAWMWFRALYPPGQALGLALALALNWAWARAGGSIQSEPMFFLWSQLALLMAVGAARHGGAARGLALGAVLAACVLTRHVGVCLALAIVVDLLWRRRTRTALVASLVCAAPVAPWVYWLLHVHHNTQVGLLARGGLGPRLAQNALFYARRIPDALVGPVVEVATVFRSSPALAAGATVCAGLASLVVIWGWLCALRTSRRRLAGLVGLTTLALLLAWPFTEAGRFVVPLVPLLLVGATEGLARLAARLRMRRPRAWAIVILMAASAPYSLYQAFSNRSSASENLQAGFDAACAWIAVEGRIPGPILTLQPGEVFWLTGRQALAPTSPDPAAIQSAIERYQVAYVLVESNRYARAPANPLERFAADHPNMFQRVWSGGPGEGTAVFAVQRGKTRL